MTTTNTMTTTIPQAIEAYLQREQRLGCGVELLRTRGFDLRAFAAWLGERFEVRELAQLRPSHLEAWQTHQSARTTPAGLPLKPGTLNTRFGNLKAWLVHEAGNGTVLDSLPAAIVFVKGPRLLPQGVLSHAQMRKMLRAIDTSHPLGYRDRTLLEVLYSSGIRRGELLGLDTEDVDLDRGLMRVLGKGGKERLVPLGKSARRHLETYLRAIRVFLLRADAPSPAVFLSKRGNRLSKSVIDAVVKRAALVLELDFAVSAHTFRRSCTTELVKSGANLWHVKELLGHEDLRTLQHYARLNIEELKKTHAKCHPRERDER